MNPDDITRSPIFVISRLMPCGKCGDEMEKHRLHDDDNALLEFKSRNEAIEFVFEFFDVTIEKLEPINKRGPHFE